MEPLTAQEKEDLIAEFNFDPVFFCKKVLYKIFTRPIPWVHRGLLSIYTRRSKFLWKYGDVWKIVREFCHRDSDEKILYRVFHVYIGEEEVDYEVVKLLEENFEPEELMELCRIELELSRFTAIIIPRGFAKTTICGFAVPLYYCLLQYREFMVYISESSTHSEMCVNNIRAELASNEVVKELFGNLVPERSSETKWTEKLFETRTGFTMAARGSGAQIRGLNHKSIRPQIMLWDDLQSREDAEDETQREKLKKWAYQDAMPALPELDPFATIIALGTLLHRECFLTQILDDEEWTVIRLSVKNPWGEYIWPENIDEEKDAAKKRQYAAVGRIQGYFLEYCSVIKAEEAQKFKRERFIFRPYSREDMVAVAIYADPAISEKTTADSAVIAVGGISKIGTYVILDEARDKGRNDMVSFIVDSYFELAMRWQPTVHGFEANGFQAALSPLFKAAMFRKRYYFEMIEVKNTQKKNSRINGNLHGIHCSGHLHFAKRFPDTENELILWQQDITDQADDGPDCWAGIIKLLEPFAPAGIAPEDVDEEYEDHAYPDLAEEFGLRAGDDWRTF